MPFERLFRFYVKKFGEYSETVLSLRAQVMPVIAIFMIAQKDKAEEVLNKIQKEIDDAREASTGGMFA